MHSSSALRLSPARSPAPAQAPVLKLNRLWLGGDFGFGDMAACDDYYIETAPQASKTPPRNGKDATDNR